MKDSEEEDEKEKNDNFRGSKERCRFGGKQDRAYYPPARRGIIDLGPRHPGDLAMAFTVTRNGGDTKDAEFEAYARLLRQQGVDLGKLPRAPEPGTGRRWLYVWNSREQAQAFADELKKRTRNNAWVVAKVAAPSSEGPMGPIIVQVGRRANGLVFGLHPLSRTVIRSAIPDAKGTATTISINFETLQDFLATHGSIEALARDVVPTLTGLELQELEKLGYTLIEDDTDRTLVFVPPGDLVQP
jgi:hypothetical protein